MILLKPSSPICVCHGIFSLSLPLSPSLSHSLVSPSLPLSPSLSLSISLFSLSLSLPLSPSLSLSPLYPSLSSYLFSLSPPSVFVERSSSVVECRTRNRESPGSNPPLLPFRRLGIFHSLHRRPCSLSCINEYLAIDSGGNVSDLVLARNCCLARMLPVEAENGVGMNRSVREGKKCQAL